MTRVRLVVVGLGWIGRKQAQVEEGALTAPKDLKPYVRIEIDDGQGGWASTNPMPIPPCL